MKYRIYFTYQDAVDATCSNSALCILANAINLILIGDVGVRVGTENYTFYRKKKKFLTYDKLAEEYLDETSKSLVKAFDRLSSVKRILLEDSRKGISRCDLIINQFVIDFTGKAVVDIPDRFIDYAEVPKVVGPNKILQPA